jgi:uncharacterized membrane protein YphA (DoxX/SURF4 family)
MINATGQKLVGRKSQAVGLVVVRISAGIFIFFCGLERASWVLDSTPLATLLSFWLADALPVSRWYLERLMPGVPVFARLLPVGAMLGGSALVLGFWTRMAAAVSLLMVLSFQVAAGSIFRYTYLGEVNGLPLAGALLGLVIGGGKLPLSVRS